MSVPLDRLYNHLDSLCDHDVIIYRFSPHGSKNLVDLKSLKDYKGRGWEFVTKHPGMICHDQEPLNFEQYKVSDLVNCVLTFLPGMQESPTAMARLTNLAQTQHIRSILSTRYSIYDKTLLVHSEQNSPGLVQYEAAGFVGVYWWAHAAIARDWFRYAEHDKTLTPDFESINKDFLIYNRAWTGTREYRLKFSELLIHNGLALCCHTAFNTHCESQYYKTFEPKNHKLKVSNHDIESYFNSTAHDSTASADYNSEDYASIAIEVVLETMFDDVRHHLTEKALRPIACGRPFILASTPGSLQYLRNYGFKTFHGIIDESYDTINDPVERLQAICNEMKRISHLPTQQKYKLWEELYAIADYNKAWFFSQQWQDQVFREFVENFRCGLEILESHKQGKHWLSFRDMWNNAPNAEEEFKLTDTLVKQSMQHQSTVESWLQKP